MKKYVSLLFMAGLAFFPIFLCCGRPSSSSLLPGDSLSITQGKNNFQKNCSGCHNFKQDGIGPNLLGISATDSVEWLRAFIRSPKSLLDSGDAHAKNLLTAYHSLMPSFTEFTPTELDQMIAYIFAQKGRKEKEDPRVIHNPIPEKIETSDLQIGLQPFVQIPSSSKKEPLTRISKMNFVEPMKAWFILDQRGLLYKLDKEKPAVWLDISKWKPSFINEPGLATGLGSFAFHPDFKNNKIFYTTHCESPHSKKADFAIPDSVKQTLQWVLCAWTVKDPNATVFTGSCRELLRIDMVAGIHGVQDIVFNPLAKPGNGDYGKLYIGVGDGGSVENGFAFLTHHLERIWGTILCIDPMGKNSANGQYGIPATNPFAKRRDSNIVREIYAYGFRNPSHISWMNNGTMLATNIGQANIEAIDIVLKGHDYGWPIREGRFEIHPTANINQLYPLPANDSSFHITYPVAVFDHDEGTAIAGGFEYHGQDLPELKGKYLFGSIPSGRLFYVNTADLVMGRQAPLKEWFVMMNGKRITLKDLCKQDRVDLRFGQDPEGNIYIFTKPDGKIYRLSGDRPSIPGRPARR